MEPDDQPPRRPSTAHDRPPRAPSGPRIRTRTKQSGDMPDTPAVSPLSRPDSPTLFNFPIPPIHTDVAVQVPEKSQHSTSTFIAPPALSPPPTITFDSTPIPWKGLPFEVAQWTFSSAELQEIVSQAIRFSARESFVRLLSLQALEVDLIHEAHRLDAERAAAQAKWRFEVGRRTMLMQALNSTVANAGDSDNENLVPTFISQLAASVASCDALLSSILHLSDQQSQITLAQHQHWASALSVALRKLNKAYERQGQELRRAQVRVRTIEDELEEAWREAEKIAIEFDELEQEVAVSEGGSEPLEDETALQVKHDLDETGTLGGVTINTDFGVVVGVTATAVATKATLVSSPRQFDKSDAKSIRSTRSRRSVRDGPTHISRVSSARTRSRAASNASLRLPKAIRSTPSTPVDALPPPIPALPTLTVSGQSFLDMQEHARQSVPPPRLPEPNAALPTPPQSAGLSPTRVPSIWLETDGGKSTRLNGLDRNHTLQIFSSLTGRTPRKARRSNLVMSLSGSDQGSGSDSATASVDGVASSTRTRTGSGSGSASHGSPVSLPTQARRYFHRRGPSASSSSNSMGLGVVGRPGSAGARLTTTSETRTPVPVATPRRSLVSRASSVILRRLSQATMASGRSGNKGPLSVPSEVMRLSVAGNALVERCGEGEVMLIGSPHAESSEDPEI